MSRKKNSYLAAGLGLVLVAGIGGTALAADNSVPNSNAGQGVSTVAGFTVTNVEYDTADATGPTADVTVDTVDFDIARDGSTSGTQVLEENAEVYAQLRESDGNADWVKCSVTTGHATCDTSASGASVNLADVSGLSVVAFDALDPV